MALYLSGKAEPIMSESSGQHTSFKQHILFTVDDELAAAGATLTTDNAGSVVCAAGSIASNADVSEVRRFNGTSWVEVP